MRCPECEKRVSWFAKSMNRAGRAKACPHCGKPVRMYVDWKLFSLIFVPFVLGAALIRVFLNSYFNIDNPIVFAVCALPVLVSVKLRQITRIRGWGLSIE